MQIHSYGALQTGVGQAARCDEAMPLARRTVAFLHHGHLRLRRLRHQRGYRAHAAARAQRARR